MIEGKRINVHDKRYELYHMPPKKAIRTLIRLMKLIGGPAVAGIKEGADKKTVTDAEVDLGKIIEKMMDRLNEADVLNLIEDVLAHVQIERSEGFAAVNLETDFQGKIGSLFVLLKEAIKHNFSDFLAEGLGLKLGPA